MEKEDIPRDRCKRGQCVSPTSAHYRHSWSLTLYQVLFQTSLAHPTQQLSGQAKTALTLHK